jgi:hypothetical protein
MRVLARWPSGRATTFSQEDAMSSHPTTTLPVPRNAPVQGELHPLVYKTLVGLTIWLVLSVWALFDRGAYVGLNLVVITAFFVVLLGIPVALWLTWRRNERAEEQGCRTDRFRDFTAQQFSTWTGRLSGRDAAVQILLPIAAVSIGMTIFGPVFALPVPHLG